MRKRSKGSDEREREREVREQHEKENSILETHASRMLGK
jgi:hypothetical protein